MASSSNSSIVGPSGAAASEPNAAGTSNAADGDGKMFFTTSDLIERMNSAIKDANVDMPKAASESGGFELQRKMPDGSYRRAEKNEMAAADFQAKMKQASEMIAGLEPQQKIEWAKHQRQEGNALFAKGDFKEAMDVYLTCLVAMDQSPTSADKKTSATSDDTDELLNMQIEKEIKLPVLLNLALSALKLGILSKAEEFCNFAMEMESGRQSVKAHFRRGRVRMLMGHYVSAELDLDNALELNTKVMSNADDCDLTEEENERAVILREKQKLSRLFQQADENRKHTKKAMEKLFKSEPAASNQEATGLYPEKKGPKLIPTVQIDHDAVDEYQPTCFQWYMRMIGRCAQKLLDIIGEEEDQGPVDVSVDQDLLNKLMEGKKDV
mmetsp:Transcript_30177/g.63942  ORF Transcript_30177/g.63942 Transcript_30177/m.63942 type:complete len:382 (-) Transcript_30177:142-1287(-)